MQITVQKKFIRTAPDKIRLIINLVRGWDIIKAIDQLKYLNKAASKPVIEILKSGLSAAKDKDLDENNLYIKSIICNEGPRLKRRRIIHKSRATAINKRMSHISLILSDEKASKVSKGSKALKTGFSGTSDTSDTLRPKGAK